MDPLQVEQNFHSLSVRDLLEARDLYHYHLIHKAGVVGTAVGLYLKRREGDTGERTFDNAVVAADSWPCVLVMVKEWIDEAFFRGDGQGIHPNEMVPKMLFLPDGRTVPVCVVKVTPGEHQTNVPEWHWPRGLMGGGFPLQVDVQGVTRTATVGCLVSDGHTTYALTNRHVCGAPGEKVYALSGGKRVDVGRASDKQRTRLPFNEVYPDFAMKRTYVNLDVGLVELGDVNRWTSQAYGLGQIGPMADLSERNFSLKLIGAKVVGYGAASGRLEGRVSCLFYRYKTVGGYEYVSDFLIAPSEDAGTQPGDSGMVWHLATDDEEPPCPLAIEWGAQVFVQGFAAGRYRFALATSLSNVCKLLDVELVQAHNTGVRPYWGQTGHYNIASFAIRALADGKLSTLMQNNIDRVSFTLEGLDPKAIKAALKLAKENDDFVPLADVPDIVWKNPASTIKGGRTRGSSRPENPTHYADIDEPHPTTGKTLRALSLADPRKNLTVKAWQAFYDACGHKAAAERGLLPFRVWQFYDEMVSAVAAGDMTRYVCAAGIVSHYVGDACQPLHGSMYADGYGNVGEGVHSCYETDMIDRFSKHLVPAVQSLVDAQQRYRVVGSGFEAARETVELMDRTAKTIDVRALIDSYIAAGSKNVVKVQQAMWDRWRNETARVMADGAHVLAMIWASAWKAGGAPASASVGPVDRQALMALYRNTKFVESLDLNHIGPVLEGGPAPAVDDMMKPTAVRKKAKKRTFA
ncbi:MAG TPA: S1/P1 Nuclease [Burkholderiales bacterium]|nr:S1/P1 Nuclease [Burkholderiales bacterium]